MCRSGKAGWTAYLVRRLSSRVSRPGPLLAAGGHGQGGPLHLPPEALRVLGHAQLGPQQAEAVAGPWLKQHGPRVQRQPADGREHGWHAVGHGGSPLLLLLLLLLVVVVLLLGVALEAWRREDDRAVAAC